MNKGMIHFIVRLILGFNFLATAIAHLKLWKFYTEDTEKITSWITNMPFVGSCMAVAFLILSLFLIAGYKTTGATLAAAGVLLVNHILLLCTHSGTGSFYGPFYNTFYHSVPFVGFCIILLYTGTEQMLFSLDNLLKQPITSLGTASKQDITLLVARIFVGTIFIRQALYLFLKDGSFIQFAETVYVQPFADTFMPRVVLWLLGLTNPFVLLIGGALLTVGYKTKWAAYGLGFFLMSIAFGHLLGDPFETSGDISMYGFNNLAFVLLVLWLENGKNKYSMDRLLYKNKAI